jgi:hypothetical protein
LYNQNNFIVLFEFFFEGVLFDRHLKYFFGSQLK